MSEFDKKFLYAYIQGFVDGFVESVKDGGLQKGLAAGIDGMNPFGTSFEDVYSDECGRHDPSWDVSRFAGSISLCCFVSAYLAPSGIALGSSSVQQVTHFSVAEQTSLKSGMWVMTGGKSIRNWIMAGGLQKIGVWKYSITDIVNKSSLRWPSGWGMDKGDFGATSYQIERHEDGIYCLWM